MTDDFRNPVLALIAGCIAVPIVAAMLTSATLPAVVAKARLPVMTVGTGTNYRNPVLAGDYSDPDVTRVGDDFYLVSSSFVNVPGLPILQSKDLVHWRIIGHALTK